MYCRVCEAWLVQHQTCDYHPSQRALQLSGGWYLIIIIIIQHLYSTLKSCRGYGGAESRKLNWPGRLVTYQNDESANVHPCQTVSTNQTQYRVTLLICAMTLPLGQTVNLTTSWTGVCRMFGAFFCDTVVFAFMMVMMMTISYPFRSTAVFQLLFKDDMQWLFGC